LTDRLQTGTATVAADADFDDGPWTVHGVAQAAEVTQGVSGERRYWPPEVLRNGAGALEGTPIVDPDEHEDLSASQPHPDAVIGEVVKAAYDDQREALVYEGELDTPERARQIQRGRVDVSPSVALQPGDEAPEHDAERVAAITGYRDLAVVTEGAHASASIDLGAAEALARHFDVGAEALADVADVQQGTPVRWNSSGDRPAYGRVESVRREGDEPLDSEIDGDQTITPPAALIEVHQPTDDGWEPSGTMVGHSLNTDTLTVIEELPAPDALADSPGGDDGADGDKSQSTPATWRTTMTEELTDTERELLAAAGQKDDPVVVEAGVRERLATNEELLDEAEAMDSPELVESNDHEALQERISTVKGLMAEALQERTGLSEAAVEAMPFEAMAAEFEDDDGDLDLEALTQSPEAGGAPTSEGQDDAGPSDEDVKRIEAIDEKLSTVGTALPESRIEALREEAADLADADDYEAALEVL
jgi:hypothetical protein